MLETQILRSGSLPLDIVFDYETFDSDDFEAEEVLEALARCSSRWKSLYITGQMLARLPRIFGRVPLLEKLCVWGIEEEKTDDGNSPPPDQINHFEIAPRLRNLELEECFPFFKLPWGQLTRYSAGGPWDAHISALARLKNVEFCSLMMAHEHDMGASYNRTLELPKLRQLKLFAERYYSREDFECPPWLVLPALTDLAIDGAMVRGLPRLLQVSKCTLRKLHLTGGCPEPGSIRPVFQSNPDLTELLITLVDRFPSSNVAPVLSLLTLGPNKPTLLPKVENIIIHVASSREDSALADMIVSRWKTTDPAASRLRSVYISNEWAPLGAQLLSKLNQLRYDGLSVCIPR